MSAFELPAGLCLANAFTQPPPQPDFVLPGLVAGTVGALVSPGATGKSFVALEIAVAVAGGADLLQLGIARHGKVLVVAAEDPATILQGRMHAIGQRLGIADREVVIERMDLLPAMALGIDLFGDAADAWTQALIERARDCRLVVIDTLSRVHSGEENERRDAARVMRNLERIAAATGAAVVFLHHITKAVALGGQGDQQQAARGSSVWIDEARWAGFLKTMDGAEAREWPVGDEFRRNFVRFGVNKANYCPPVLDVWLRRDEGGVLVPAELVKGKPSDLRAPTVPPVPARVAAVAAALGVEVCNDPDSL